MEQSSSVTDGHDAKRHDARYCRTHAFAATLFAAYPRRSVHADMWNGIAQLWSDLAGFRERLDSPAADAPDRRP